MTIPSDRHRFSGRTEGSDDIPSKTVPLVIYGPLGERIVIGEVSVDGTDVSGSITDHRYSHLLNTIRTGEFSLVAEPAQAVAHNVFDQNR